MLRMSIFVSCPATVSRAWLWRRRCVATPLGRLLLKASTPVENASESLEMVSLNDLKPKSPAGWISLADIYSRVEKRCGKPLSSWAGAVFAHDWRPPKVYSGYIIALSLPISIPRSNPGTDNPFSFGLFTIRKNKGCLSKSLGFTSGEPNTNFHNYNDLPVFVLYALGH